MAKKSKAIRSTVPRVAAKRRSARRTKSKNRLANFVVPLFFMFCVLFCLGVLIFLGYKTATASSFFNLQSVVVKGASRSSSSKIEDIVKAKSARTGVWNADLDLMKSEIEKLKFVKTASISKVLPNKLRVIVNERIPRAAVRIKGKDFWVDEDALILSRVSDGEKRPSFTIFGWDENKTQRASKDNKKRVALFVELQEEWRKFDLASRVKAIDLSDLKDPRAIVSDSGETVTIYLGRKDFRLGLKMALENIAGRGKDVESIIVGGPRPIIGYRNL